MADEPKFCVSPNRPEARPFLPRSPTMSEEIADGCLRGRSKRIAAPTDGCRTGRFPLLWGSNGSARQRLLHRLGNKEHRAFPSDRSFAYAQASQHPDSPIFPNNMRKYYVDLADLSAEKLQELDCSKPPAPLPSAVLMNSSRIWNLIRSRGKGTW